MYPERIQCPWHGTADGRSQGRCELVFGHEDLNHYWPQSDKDGRIYKCLHPEAFDPNHGYDREETAAPAAPETLRDRFAMAAFSSVHETCMKASIAARDANLASPEQVAHSCYEFADAMLLEDRKK